MYTLYFVFGYYVYHTHNRTGKCLVLEVSRVVEWIPVCSLNVSVVRQCRPTEVNEGRGEARKGYVQEVVSMEFTFFIYDFLSRPGVCIETQSKGIGCFTFTVLSFHELSNPVP